MTRRSVFMLLILAVFLVWVFMLVHSVRLEERAAAYRDIRLDDTGRPEEIVWEIGKGYRLPTDTERANAQGREE